MSYQSEVKLNGNLQKRAFTADVCMKKFNRKEHEEKTAKDTKLCALCGNR